MNRPRRSTILWIATLPLTWALLGCGGGEQSKPAPKPPKTEEGKPAKTDETAAPGGEKAEKVAAKAGAAEGWGTIKGTVVWGGEVTEPALIHKQGDSAVKDAATCAAKDMYSEELVVSKENKGVKWVVVSVARPAAIHPDLQKAEGEAELGQQFCVFLPHVLSLREGQKLKITSSDPVGHNTNLSPFRNQSWNQILPAASGGNKTELEGPQLVAEPNPIPVACNIHPWMKAWIVVFNHPYNMVTGDDGSFELKNVPAGTVKLVTWQERIGYGPGGRAGQDVEVLADQVTDLGNITLQPK